MNEKRLEKKQVRITAADVAECAVFTALMAAGTYISIPIPVMPITFQTVFAVLAGLVLGWKKGMISTAAFAVMGLIGLPVFTGGGGIFYVLKPSFGYIIGFIASAGVAGIGYKRERKLIKTLLLAVSATLVDYVFGIAYFIFVWQILGNPALWASVISYNLIYLPKDLILALPAALICRAVNRAMPRKNRLKKKIENE